MHSAYLDDAQRVVQLCAHFLFLLLFFLFQLGGVLGAVVVNAEAEEDLHGAKVVVEVAETHLVETCRQQWAKTVNKRVKVRGQGQGRRRVTCFLCLEVDLTSGIIHGREEEAAGSVDADGQMSVLAHARHPLDLHTSASVSFTHKVASASEGHQHLIIYIRPGQCPAPGPHTVL